MNRGTYIKTLIVFSIVLVIFVACSQKQSIGETNNGTSESTRNEYTTDEILLFSSEEGNFIKDNVELSYNKYLKELNLKPKQNLLAYISGKIFDYSYEIFVTQEENDLYNYYVINDKDNKFIQIISRKVHYSFEWLEMSGDDRSLISFQDINFDGQKDIIIRLDGAQVNQGYAGWVWSEKTKTFSKVESYAEICNPIFDLENKLIYSWVHSSTAEKIYSIFSYQNSSYLLQAKLLKTYATDGSGTIEYKETYFEDREFNGSFTTNNFDELKMDWSKVIEFD